jgi:hypothetical protein
MPLNTPLFSEFAEPFAYSSRGNLWRTYETREGRVTLTVFKRPSDPRDTPMYGWCVAGRERPRYSRFFFYNEASAMRDLYRHLLGVDP